MIFSVVTPTLNQAEFIGKAIQSVIDQRYPAFEHIVFDGGSTDSTVEVLKKYPHLKWISEKDQGRADALNKGFALAAGEIIAWINSDDYYLPGAFQKTADFFNRNPNAQVLVGRAKVVDAVGQFLFDQDSYPDKALNFEGLLRFWKYATLPQPSLFFRRDALIKVGMFDDKLHDYPDYDLVLRLSRQFKIYSIPDFLSCIRIQKNAGSVLDIQNGVLEKKLYRVSHPHWKFLSGWGRIKIFCSYWSAYPFIQWRACYESFAMAHKAELKKSWSELSKTEFFKKHAGLILTYPVQSLWAALGFTKKCFYRKRA